MAEELKRVVVRVEYDDHGNQVADKFIEAVQKLGLKGKCLWTEEKNLDDTHLDYEIVKD